MRAGPLTAGVAVGTIAAAVAIVGGVRPMPVALPPPPPGPLAIAPAGDGDAAFARDLFGSGTPPAAPGETSAPDADEPPAVIGIVGRLDRDAVVLVRRTGGGTRTLAPGEAAGDWRLESIAADAVLFRRGDRRVRVDLPAG